MTNCEKYHFTDFTLEQYGLLLKTAKKTYVFRKYSDFSRSERFILWRHDVDFSIHASRDLARIEASAGVTATYFVNFHSSFYNLLEATSIRLVREIMELGHDIALHFDPHFYGISNENDLPAPISAEGAMLGRILGREVPVFSFHCPDQKVLTFEQDQYGGLVNTYSAYFKQEVGYCSDSNGIWRHRRLSEVLEQATDHCLQVLTHPAWWRERVMSPWERIQYCIDGRARNVMAEHLEAMGGDKRLLIDWQ